MRRLRGMLALLGATCVATSCSGDVAKTPDGASPDGGALPGDPLLVSLEPQAGITGVERVSFTVPLPEGALTDVTALHVTAGGVALPVARRSLATFADGTARSVLVQVDVDIDAVTRLDVSLGGAPVADGIELVPVADTLLGGGAGPRVWARLPAIWLAGSGVAGPAVADAHTDGTALDAWDRVCDYERFDADAFTSEMSDRGPWLYDRVTALYRAYVRSGSASALASAHREAFLYFDGLTGSGTATRIGVPGAEGDLKYHYSQGLALHYLLTGDERFRERAEDLADRAAALWPSPGYAGGSDFWTERHAGFGLLAQVWAATVSDDRAKALLARADAAVAAYVEIQESFPAGHTDDDARCFAHAAAAHDEPFGTVGCSPWMSAILADGLDAYARLRADAPLGVAARTAIVKLGRAIARYGRDGSGKPHYWMQPAPGGGEVDPYEEHWGESAYVVAMAWHLDGRRDAELRAAADELVAGLAARGEVPHIRSFNWQCRSAPMAPAFLLP